MGVVFAILGGILKWIFLILLGLLGLLLVLFLIVLLTPVRYEIHWEKGADSKEGIVKVSWLLHLISFRLEQKDKEIKWIVRIGPKIIAASYPLPKKKPKRQKTKSEPPLQPPQAEKTEGPPQQAISSGRAGVKPEERPAVDELLQAEGKAAEVPAAPEKSKAETTKAETPEAEEAEPVNPAAAAAPKCKKSWRRKVTDICWKIRRIFERIIHPFRTIWEKIQRLCRSLQNLRDQWDVVKEIWNGYPQKTETVQAIKAMTVGLLKVPLPKKYDVQLRFGMKDPATTGQILMYYYSLAPVLFPKSKRGRRLLIEADFENPVIEVRAKCKGHFSVGSFLRPVIRALLNGHIRRLIRYVLSVKKKFTNKEK